VRARRGRESGPPARPKHPRVAPGGPRREGATHDHLRRTRLKDGQLGEHGLAARAEQPLPSPRSTGLRNRRDERARARRVCMQGSPLHHPRRHPRKPEAPSAEQVPGQVGSSHAWHSHVPSGCGIADRDGRRDTSAVNAASAAVELGTVVPRPAHGARATAPR